MNEQEDGRSQRNEEQKSARKEEEDANDEEKYEEIEPEDKVWCVNPIGDAAT